MQREKNEHSQRADHSTAQHDRRAVGDGLLVGKRPKFNIDLSNIMNARGTIEAADSLRQSAAV